MLIILFYLLNFSITIGCNTLKFLSTLPMKFVATAQSTAEYENFYKQFIVAL
jgi:hypothetical protein